MPAAIDRNPKNTDILQSSKYLLIFSRLASTQYFCQTVNLPGVSVPETKQETPFSDLYRPGDKIQYDTFDIEFIIDEELTSWKGIHDWIRGISFPESFDEYKNLNRLSPVSMQSNQPQYSDATVTLLTGLNNAKIRVVYTDVFPVSLSSINFDTQVSADTIMTARASFRFSRYDFTKI